MCSKTLFSEIQAYFYAMWCANWRIKSFTNWFLTLVFYSNSVYWTHTQLRDWSQQPRVLWRNFPSRHTFPELSDQSGQANIYPVIVFSSFVAKSNFKTLNAQHYSALHLNLHTTAIITFRNISLSQTSFITKKVSLVSNLC